MTSKLRMNPELILQHLFGDTIPEVKIVDATFDHKLGVIELHFDGPGVPETEYCWAQHETRVIRSQLFPLQEDIKQIKL